MRAASHSFFFHHSISNRGLMGWQLIAPLIRSFWGEWGRLEVVRNNNPFDKLQVYRPAPPCWSTTWNASNDGQWRDEFIYALLSVSFSNYALLPVAITFNPIMLAVNQKETARNISDGSFMNNNLMCKYCLESSFAWVHFTKRFWGRQPK